MSSSTSAKSVYDWEIQSTIKQARGNFHASPSAWEDQLLYFLLPDRFSNNEETQYIDNSGRIVSDGRIVPYKASDRNDALSTAADTEAWQDAGGVFCGGTIKGIISKLGYLKRMGVTALWVGPIFKQIAALQTYHGYGVQNFLDVDPRFGTKEDFRDLVTQSHAIGMFVIQDIICNHTGDVFEYSGNSNPNWARDNDDSPAQVYPVQGFYDVDHINTVPFEKIDLTKTPGVFPDAAIWPSELQDGNAIFTREGKINDWDGVPEYLDGDFDTLKDLQLGVNDPDQFVPTPALKTLVECYKYWIAFADLDAFRLDTVKHMGWGPTRYFANSIHEYATSIGKESFLIAGEVTGSGTYETISITGLDAALGIGGLQEALWKIPKGLYNPQPYFDLFRNALYLKEGSHSWLRNKVVTMIDDHDQVWRGDTKGRFCSDAVGTKLMFPALALNLSTLGIPCIFYGSEQCFDGHGSSGLKDHGADQWIRECMFGGPYGAFCSRDAHFFNEETDVYQKLAKLAAVRRGELALTRGRQYLREISGDGVGFGYPATLGTGPMQSIVAWSRIFNGEEILCAINTDIGGERSVWVTIDADINGVGDVLQPLYQDLVGDSPRVLPVEARSGRTVVSLTMAPASFAMFKK